MGYMNAVPMLCVSTQLAIILAYATWASLAMVLLAKVHLFLLPFQYASHYFNPYLLYIQDFDECLTSSCGSNTLCHNTSGSASCTCAEGYIGLPPLCIGVSSFYF